MLKGKVCRHGVKMNGKYGNTERQLLMFFEKCACEGKQRAREIVGEWIISKKKRDFEDGWNVNLAWKIL